MIFINIILCIILSIFIFVFIKDYQYKKTLQNYFKSIEKRDTNPVTILIDRPRGSTELEKKASFEKNIKNKLHEKKLNDLRSKL